DPVLEIGAMHYLSKRPPHGNVMFMHAVYEDASFLFLELECLGGGDLFEAVQGSPGGKFPEARARRVLRQVLQGLCFMHGHGIIHRDLSLGELGRRLAAACLPSFGRVAVPATPSVCRCTACRSLRCAENVMLASRDPGAEVKIIDMGLCVDRWRFAPGLIPPQGCVGKAAYMAPETYLDSEFDESVDLWCVAVMLFMMLFGVPPYRKPHAGLCALFREIEAGRLLDLVAKWGMGGSVSPDAQDLLRRMLSVSRADRPTLPEVLAHPWMAPEMADLGGAARAAEQASLVLDVGARVNRMLHEQRQQAAAAASGAAAAAPAAVALHPLACAWSVAVA
ncbi:CPK1, partial [Symbiodinium sp. KB8]